MKGSEVLGQIDTESISESVGGKARFEPFSFFNFDSNYKFSKQTAGKRFLKTEDTIFLLQNQNVSAGVNGNL